MMKNNTIKIAVVEDGHFYNKVIEEQIYDICLAENKKNLNWIVKSIGNAQSLLTGKSAYQIILFDSYQKNNQSVPDSKVDEVIESIKEKNKNCLLISISGYREMVVRAEFIQDGETVFCYSKQSNIKNDRFEESCSIPSINTLLIKYLHHVYPQEGTQMKHTA
ncbi:MAG: hypothetical protein V4613_02235 [Bacteroidota bacterium]